MYDVIVVGARVAGAATAMLMARAGLRVLVVDRASFPSDTLSTHQVHTPGMAHLARWGLLGPIAAASPATASIRVDVGGVAFTGRVPRVGEISTMHSPRRTLLDSVVLDEARRSGAEVRERFAVKELIWSDGRVVGVRGHDTGRRLVAEGASLVVGADGKHSFVARAAGAPIRRQGPPMTFASYSYWCGVPASGEIYHGPGYVAAAFPTNDDLTMVYLGGPAAEFDAFRSDVERRYLAGLDRCGDLGERVRAGTRAERIRTTPDLPNTVRVPYGPGWALVGDAGLVMDPISAQGISNAFADAELLAAAVTEGLGGATALSDALAAYEQRRDRRVMGMYAWTLRLAELRADPRITLLLESLAARPAEADRFVGLLAGAVPVEQYFSARNLLRLTGAGLLTRANRVRRDSMSRLHPAAGRAWVR